MTLARLRSAPACALLAFVAVACAAQSQADPQQTAEKITRAVYANDLGTTVANFDDETKKSVTREALGDMSDKMHALGDLTSLAQKSANPDTGRYEYDAHFTSGTLLVQLRIDPSGKVGAYRVVPENASPVPTAASNG